NDAHQYKMAADADSVAVIARSFHCHTPPVDGRVTRWRCNGLNSFPNRTLLHGGLCPEWQQSQPTARDTP
ncbi:hypothetical protein, partial [Providencia huaxiensis]|uniref:hypothetical protein n=1 Tax=Providencia huaxiensis TaxID=2027290 RepID=UPI0034E4E694